MERGRYSLSFNGEPVLSRRKLAPCHRTVGIVLKSNLNPGGNMADIDRCAIIAIASRRLHALFFADLYKLKELVRRCAAKLCLSVPTCLNIMIGETTDISPLLAE